MRHPQFVTRAKARSMKLLCAWLVVVVVVVVGLIGRARGWFPVVARVRSDHTSAPLRRGFAIASTRRWIGVPSAHAACSVAGAAGPRRRRTEPAARLGAQGRPHLACAHHLALHQQRPGTRLVECDVCVQAVQRRTARLGRLGDAGRQWRTAPDLAL
jgi:hypothetical protein